MEHAEDMLSSETEHGLHGHLCYADGTVIASREGRNILHKMDQSIITKMQDQALGSILPGSTASQGMVAGFAHSAGFETYRTGWFAIIIEERQ